jgi:signal transduction histidine kinase
MLSREQFLKHLREALNHLYDPNYLRQSPLTALFDIADRFDTPSYLQNILIEAIESIKSEADESSHSPHRQIYDLLLYRYVEQFSQKEVADQFGISVRHLRREQHAALEVLAYRLWDQFHLKTKIGERTETETPAPQPTTTGVTVNDELAWLKNVPPESNADLKQTLPVVLDLVRPLATQHKVHLEITLADDLPNLVVHLVALRQILLNLLTVAINQSTGSQVTISAKPLHWTVEIQIEGEPSSSPTEPLSDK